MGDKLDTADVRVAEIALRQHGVITLLQLEEAGLGRRGASKRVAKGQLHRIHRGVYAVGHRSLSLHGRFMAAVLACGEGAVLSHVSAAVLWELLYPIDGPVHVTTPKASGRARRPGIYLHRSPSLPLTTYRERIPVTTVSRTIEDLRSTDFLEPHLVRRAIRQAELKGYRLDGIASDRTRSDLESLFLAIIRRHRLPHPEVNVKLGRYEVDSLWRSHNLVVETDSWTYHRGSAAFYADGERDLELRSQGFSVLRFTDQQLEQEPERVAADVSRALNREVAA